MLSIRHFAIRTDEDTDDPVRRRIRMRRSHRPTAADWRRA
jgi:hypothetical protein